MRSKSIAWHEKKECPYSALLRTDSIQGMTPSNVHVDYDYLDVYEMELVAGRNFSEERPLDDGYAFIINESFAKELNLEDPIGAS